METNARYGHVVFVDEGARVGEQISWIVEHRKECKTCGTKVGTGTNWRLCAAGELYIGRLIQAWVAGDHHRFYSWMVSDAA